MPLKSLSPNDPNYSAIREYKNLANFKPGDYLVLFGEVFNRGYANGLIEEAQRLGMKVIYSTVGRREKDQSLRPLTEEELSQALQPLINVPLEAGFDMEGSPSPLEQMKDCKLSEWQNCPIDFSVLENSVMLGRKRFLTHVRSYLSQLERIIEKGHNIYFAHLMAGGVPRAKIIMPLMNRTFKGLGDRFLESEQFWKSNLGKVCEKSFEEVTATTFKILIEETSSFRDRAAKEGTTVCYSAFGYHGTEIFSEDLSGAQAYRWQTYSPYLQGWAKRKLEEIAIDYSRQGVKAVVYNCPEILTNSSAIFQGLEVCLYPFLLALDHEHPNNSEMKQFVKSLKNKIKPEVSQTEILKLCTDYLYHPAVQAQCRYEGWPTHNTKDQLAVMLETSEKLHEMQVDPKSSITAPLSEVIVKGCGKIMLEDVFTAQKPVRWINQDVLAKIATSVI